MKTFFSTQILQKKLGLRPSLVNELLNTALKLPEVDDVGVRWCKKNYRNGYTSYGSLNTLHQQFSVFDLLKTRLDVAVKKYAYDLGLKFDTGCLQLSALWVNVMPKDCYHAFHAHPLSVISGTFYLQTSHSASPLRIEDPRAPLFMASPARSIQMDLRPKVGEVILFESWLKHEVPPHTSAKPRVSVSFNYDWVDR